MKIPLTSRASGPGDTARAARIAEAADAVGLAMHDQALRVPPHFLSTRFHILWRPEIFGPDGSLGPWLRFETFRIVENDRGRGLSDFAAMGRAIAAMADLPDGCFGQDLPGHPPECPVVAAVDLDTLAGMSAHRALALRTAFRGTGIDPASLFSHREEAPVPVRFPQGFILNGRDPALLDNLPPFDDEDDDFLA